MNSVQAQSFRYFWDFAEPNSSLARERFHPNGDYPLKDSHIITSGDSGFGLMNILVGIKRGFVIREAGIGRLHQIADFLKTADRFHGVWPPWINGITGKVKPCSKKDDGGDLVKTSFLAQGLICVRQFCDTTNVQEKVLAHKVNQLWEEIEWSWYTQGNNQLFWHRSPSSQFLSPCKDGL